MMYDVPCQMCDMICTSLPSLQVLKMDDVMVNCIGMANRVKIIRCRDEDQQSNMIQALIYELDEGNIDTIMCPPDFVTKQGFTMDFYEHTFENIRCIISIQRILSFENIL